MDLYMILDFQEMFRIIGLNQTHRTKKNSEDKLNFMSNSKWDHYNRNWNLTSNQTLAQVTFLKH